MRISDWSSECALPICMARHPGMPGKYMDVALHNRSGPGTPASQAIPKGLRLGDEIELLPPERKQARNAGGADGTTNTQTPPDGGPSTIPPYRDRQSAVKGKSVSVRFAPGGRRT